MRKFLFFGKRINRGVTTEQEVITVHPRNRQLNLDKELADIAAEKDIEEPSTEDDGKTYFGRHHQGAVSYVHADWHPAWTELDPEAAARWTLRFMGYATYTVPLGRLADYLRRKRDEELANWAWLNIDFINWPEHWKSAQWT